jgi:hypothetical protein
MPTIAVPRPKSIVDPDRPANALLMTQVKHLQQAERQLPLRYRTEIYIHAIHTEQEAAEYIREVTEAIHKAHADAEKKRARKNLKPRKVAQLAASAASPSRRRSKKKVQKNTRARKRK